MICSSCDRTACAGRHIACQICEYRETSFDEPPGICDECCSDASDVCNFLLKEG